MIIYQATKQGFEEDILTNAIHDKLVLEFEKKKLGKRAQGEINSWKNSLIYFHTVIADDAIPATAGISIEYNIPQTGKRVDVIVSGQDENDVEHIVIVELKQWSQAERTEKDAVVRTFVGKGLTDQNHPSYQAWSYATLLEGFSEVVYTENVVIKPCAYLHNYQEDGVLNDPFYEDYLSKAPVFFKSDALKLREFIKRFIKYGDKRSVMYRIDNGRIKPSKSLSDHMASLLKGNQDFIMIDDQKLVYEEGMALSRRASPTRKQVLIVEGGPGTGKSVVAVNLLVNILKMGQNAQYVTKNAAPREVYASRLASTFKKTVVSNLFKGSGGYYNVESSMFQTLVVDEAHRLNEKSGMYGVNGENQVKELINSSNCAIFFLDENQRVTLKDIGSVEQIEKWAKYYNAPVTKMALTSQFRCNGSDGYMAWIDNTLQIRETANKTLEGVNYEFKVFDSPAELMNAIILKNTLNNKARVVAGYCWDWKSKNSPGVFDIVFPNFSFAKRWNLSTYGNLWLIDSASVEEVGCIHTCQGLELDYVGVIIGPDLIVRNGEVVVDPSKRSGMDSSIKGYKKRFAENIEGAKEQVEAIIKNTYRTLMTRGMKGCYIYSVDEETQQFLKASLDS